MTRSLSLSPRFLRRLRTVLMPSFAARSLISFGLAFCWSRTSGAFAPWTRSVSDRRHAESASTASCASADARVSNWKAATTPATAADSTPTPANSTMSPVLAEPKSWSAGYSRHDDGTNNQCASSYGTWVTVHTSNATQAACPSNAVITAASRNKLSQASSPDPNC